MEEVVIKRTANITSAEALDEINSAYPNAEVLSFRKIKESGSDNEFFVARLSVNEMEEQMPESMNEPDLATVSDEEGNVIVEDKEHEEREEDTLNEIVRLLKKIVKEREPEQQPEEGPAPLPQPQKPPFSVGGPGLDFNPVASLVVERKANISKTAARIELIKEFGKEYIIGDIEEEKNKYRVSLFEREKN